MAPEKLEEFPAPDLTFPPSPLGGPSETLKIINQDKTQLGIIMSPNRWQNGVFFFFPNILLKYFTKKRSGTAWGEILSGYLKCSYGC